MKYLRHLFVLFLGLFGVSCDKLIDIVDGGGMMCMYGSPYADYKVKGTVKDNDGKPIAGIKVTPIRYKDCPLLTIVPASKADGSYEVSFGDSPLWRDDDEIKLIFEDIDGPLNGGDFETGTITVDFGQLKKDDKNNGSWYVGEYSASNVDIKLHKK